MTIPSPTGRNHSTRRVKRLLQAGFIQEKSIHRTASQYRSGPKEKQEMEGLHKLHEFE